MWYYLYIGYHIFDFRNYWIGDIFEKTDIDLMVNIPNMIVHYLGFVGISDFVDMFERKIFSWVYDKVKEEEKREREEWKRTRS